MIAIRQEKRLCVQKKSKKESESDGTLIPMLKDGTWLFALYMIMSQSFVKKAIGTYIPCIASNPDGTKPMIGIAIYGLILTILFVVIKKLLL